MKLINSQSLKFLIIMYIKDITYWQIFIFSVSVDRPSDSSAITKSERAINVPTQLLERPFLSNICLTKFIL